MTETTETAEDPVPSAPIEETNEQARSRARACTDELLAVARRFGCRIVAHVLPAEPVGNDRTGALIRAAWGVIPDPL